jgi:hydroxymethylglutaryl-CoA lyase
MRAARNALVGSSARSFSAQATPATALLHEVSPRDGLQNESIVLSTDEKMKLLEKLALLRPKSIEITSFVRADRVPQLADASDLCERLGGEGWFEKATGDGMMFAAFVPNLRGYENFSKFGCLDTISCIISATDGHSKANVGKTVAEAIEETTKLVRAAKADGITVRGYASMAFGCPIDGDTDPALVQDIVAAYAEAGADQVILADTIGVAYPDHVEKLVSAALAVLPPAQLGLHMHDTFGRALENCQQGLNQQLVHFDSAVGGCGGCPFAPGAAGNLATDRLVGLFETNDVSHGVGHEEMEHARVLLQEQLGRELRQ